jgi:hypothetical protein
MKEAGPNTADQIKQQIREVAEEILHVIAKDPQEKHIAENVHKSRMQKHTSKQRQKCSHEAYVPGQERWETRWYRGVGHDKGLEQVRRQRHLIHKHGDVRADK